VSDDAIRAQNATNNNLRFYVKPVNIKHMKMVIGLTGGSGVGKTVFSFLLGDHAIDADRVYAELLATSSQMQGELITAFGTRCKRELAGIVFGDPDKLALLNQITHKYIMQRIVEMIPDVGVTVIDAPLLFEAGADKICDVTVAMVADIDVRIARIMARDNISTEQAEARIAAQQDDDYYRSRAHHIIDSTAGNLALIASELKQQVKEKVCKK
jgi:dephospho-CoA kinase